MSDDLDKLTEDFRALGRKEGAMHPATEEHYTQQERKRWVAAVDALYEEKKSDYQEDGSDMTLQYFEGATTVLEQLLTRMEAKEQSNQQEQINE